MGTFVHYYFQEAEHVDIGEELIVVRAGDVRGSGTIGSTGTGITTHLCERMKGRNNFEGNNGNKVKIFFDKRDF